MIYLYMVLILILFIELERLIGIFVFSKRNSNSIKGTSKRRTVTTATARSLLVNISLFNSFSIEHSVKIEQIANDEIQVEILLAGYAIVTLPESMMDALVSLEEVE